MVTQWPKNHESYPAPYHHFESMTSKRMTLGHILSLGAQPSLSFNQPTAQIPRPSWPHAALVGNIFCRWVTGDHKRCQMSSPICNTSYDFVILLRHRAIADFSLKNQEHPRTSFLSIYLVTREPWPVACRTFSTRLFAQLLKLRAAESQGSRPLWITAKSCIK